VGGGGGGGAAGGDEAVFEGDVSCSYLFLSLVI
jgi:hypothetical protein